MRPTKGLLKSATTFRTGNTKAEIIIKGTAFLFPTRASTIPLIITSARISVRTLPRSSGSSTPFSFHIL
mgnify:CR=1 FL=1